jgi:DNA-directed RNA polymerase specialized sigma24 family protein
MADSRPTVVEQPSERAEAFLRLADDHLDAAYRLARAILRDPTEAQDATHDAFEQAWRNGRRCATRLGSSTGST